MHQARSCTVRLLSLPTRDRLVAAHDPAPAGRRELTIIELVDGAGRSGFGECSALTRVGYTNEWARGSFEQIVASEGQPGPDAPMARAGIEMATLDLALRAEALSLGDHLHARSRFGMTKRPTDLPAGVVLPIASINDTVAAAIGYAERGLARLKLKIRPGHDTEVVRAVRSVCPSVELHVDANGSFDPDDLDVLISLADAGVSVIEQPFPVGERRTTARLTAASPALVVADESAVDLASVIDLVEHAIVSGIVIKPSRLGGLAAAVEVHDWCIDAGIGVSAGGMLESGLGRHALAALASLPGFTIAGDLSPARRWLAEDPFVDLTMCAGRIAVPTAGGVAPPPDRDLLDRLTIDRATIE